MDLIVVIVATLLMIPLVVLTTGAVRIALGVAFLIFFPGYALAAVLFPRKGSLEPVERLFLSFALSIALVPLAGLILNYTPWGIRLYPIVVCIASFILISAGIALYRRRAIPADERFEPHLRVTMPRWARFSARDRVLAAALLLSVIGAVATLAYVVAVPRHVENFTEFYILGEEGMADHYPHEALVGQPVQIPIVIVNQEHQYTTYRVAVTIDGEELLEISPIELPHGGRWEGEAILTLTQAGADQKVEFLLHVVHETDPYLTLRLWLDVSDPQ